MREMRDASQGLRGRPAVEAILDAAARRHMAELPLLNATMSVLWSQDLGRLMCKRLGRPPAIELIGAVLKDAAALGAPMADADPELLAEMLWGVYMAALRRTIRENLDLEALRGLVRDQVEVLLTGATRN